MSKETVLISACLLGMTCRYDGQSKPMPPQILAALTARYHLVPVCPEVYGGLSTPRRPAERQGGRVVTACGDDVTAAFKAGAVQTLELALLLGCKLAIFKEKSPSCGTGIIYDGTFTRTLTSGDGITTALLQANGIRVVGESSIEAIL